MTTTNQRMPVVYVPHGGGPWPWVDVMPKEETAPLATYLRALPQVTPTPPKAVLVISAHWEEPRVTVMTAERPPMLYDYYGFPPEAYTIQWPAPGAPALAERTRGLLSAAGIEAAADPSRGFDHGTFVPLKLAYPEADIPTLQVSLKKGLDPREHLAIGRALAPLRDEGVFIVGSGMSYHNMQGFRSRLGQAEAGEFDAWLRESIGLAPAQRDDRLADWSKAPAARAAHPREEHLLPLMVVTGAAGDDRGVVPYGGAMMGFAVSAVHYG